MTTNSEEIKRLVRERYGASLNQDPPTFEELLEKYEGYENDSGDDPERGE